MKCQEDSPFAPLIMTDDLSGNHTYQGFFVANNFAQFSVPLLSLTQTEADELLRISKEFPPPPEGDIADVCVSDSGFAVSNFDIAMISMILIATFSVSCAFKCHLNRW